MTTIKSWLTQNTRRLLYWTGQGGLVTSEAFQIAQHITGHCGKVVYTRGSPLPSASQDTEGRLYTRGSLLPSASQDTVGRLYIPLPSTSQDTEGRLYQRFSVAQHRANHRKTRKDQRVQTVALHLYASLCPL